MKRAVWALLACGLLAACEDLPTDVMAGVNGNGLTTTNAATTAPGGNVGVTPARGSQPTPVPNTTPPKTTPTPTPVSTPAPANTSTSEATINGNQVSIAFAEEESVSYINGVAVKKK